MTMTSSRPYLVRALYEWILDNDCTPYVLVNALADSVHVPEEYVKDGQIILNIAPAAVENLVIGDEDIDFDGRFAGLSRQIYFPISAVMGIYAKENGQGMIFETEAPQPPDPDAEEKTSASAERNKVRAKEGKPRLKIVK